MANPTYFIAGELGKGGFGVVYLLKSDKDGPPLAMKTVDLRKIPEDFRERAKDEAKLLQNLSNPYLVHHVNSYMRHPYLCIIMEFCAAGDLEKFIKHLGFKNLPEKLITCWLMQAASGLNYMHTHDPVVLHRDLKPQNIYITGTGGLRLGDLGLARKLAGPQDMATTVAGTIVYLSPEMLNQKPYNSKTDIWSLGCVFYDIASMKSKEEEMGLMFLLFQVMGGRNVPLPEIYSEGLRETILRMLTKDPQERPSAGNILNSTVVQSFRKNPEEPANIIAEHARKERRPVPKIPRDLADIRCGQVPLDSRDILVPLKALEDLKKLNSPKPIPMPKPRLNPVKVEDVAPVKKEDKVNPMRVFNGMSENSMILFGGARNTAASGPSAAVEGAVGGSDDANETFFDSKNEPEYDEEHFLAKIQGLQVDCTNGLGTEVLQAAYGIIANVRDLSMLKVQLEELLGKSLYTKYSAKILELRVLEYALHKKLSSVR
ncbi:serine/threonine-protein kinase Nek4-like [Pomacea canaliculata]|uniref:serine/threonine-protein kinase Nek4-like n=1 Tax=Pomacea canaliculata TaxID=400727 RepID=UPI000D7335E6|nr:serine/threonine-protein kinase Nek4-like [Pomacea canaliculata]